jgi:hypothetical protein
MAIRHNRLAALVLAVLVALEAAAQAQSPEEVATERREAIARLFRPDYADVAARERQVCFLGKQPQRVIADRARGAYFTPDAADTCIAALTRLGSDQQLPEQYRKFIAAIGGDVATAAALPRAIGAAVMNGQQTVALGNGRGADVDSAIAFDAGFATSFREGAAAPPGSVDEAQLKAVTETCLANQQDRGTCYSVGYLQGARAHQQVAARR